MLSPDGVTPAAVAAYFLATVPDMKRRRDTPGYVDADAYTPDELMRSMRTPLRARRRHRR